METTGTNLGQKLHDLYESSATAYGDKFREILHNSSNLNEGNEKTKTDAELKYLLGRLEAFEEAWEIVSDELCHLSNDISHILSEARKYKR